MQNKPEDTSDSKPASGQNWPDVTDGSPSATQLALLLDYLPVGLYTCGATGDNPTYFISDNIPAFTGYRPEDFYADAAFWFSRIHPDDQPAVLKAFGDPDRTGCTTLDYRCRISDGSYRWFRDQWRLVRSHAPGSELIVGFFLDITDYKETEEALRHLNVTLEQRVAERTALLESTIVELKAEMEAHHRAEAALYQSERDYRGLFENAHDAIIIFDPDQEAVLEVNPRACEIYGFGREEFIGLSLERISKDIPRGKDHIRATLTATHPYHFESIQFRKDGMPIRLEINASEVEYQGRRAILSLNRDITQKAMLEDKLRQSQKMEAIGTLAGGIAHDFNNMLSAIIGNLELGMMDLPVDHEVRENLDQALKAAFRAAELVRQILSFSHQGESEPKPVRLATVVRESLQMLRVTLPENVECHLEISVEESVVLADPIQINQVVMNLCTNAVHALRDRGGILRVESGEVDLPPGHADLQPEMQPGRFALLRVSDTGHGMSRDVQERIFEPFFTTKKAGEGTGLGLSVVYGIVRKFGGSIGVESQPDVGTIFKIYLPLLGHGAPETIAQQAEVPHGRGRILYVDDEQNLVRLGERMLGRLGYEIVASTDSTQALDLFLAEPERFDLVITDQAMPRLTGLELAEEMLSIRPELPIILCTGYSQAATTERAREQGVRELLMKPLNFKILAETIARLLPGAGI